MALEAKHEDIVARRVETKSEERVQERPVAVRKPDLFARVMGFLVFALGIAIIVGVLWLALQMWNDPNLGIKTSSAASVGAVGVAGGASGVATGPSAADIGIGFGRLILRLGLLFLGSISGSLIANKGIKLYFSAFADPDKP